MNKKIIILILFLFLLCGCSANVDLVVSDGGIEESVNITALEDNYLSKDQIKGAFREFIPAYEADLQTEIVDTMPDQKKPNIDYYTKNTTELSSGYIINYKYKFGLNDYVKSSTMKKAFSSSSIIKDPKENTLTLSTDSAGILLFKEYPNLTEIKVNIKAEYPVKENNADSVNNNVYTWVFTPDTKKSIYILYDVKDESNSSNNTNNGETGIFKEDSKKDETEFSKFINKHPILAGLSALVLFFVFIFIVTKVVKIKK